MSTKDQKQAIQELQDQQEVRDWIEQRETKPIYDDDWASITTPTRIKNHEWYMEMRNKGLVVPRPIQDMESFVAASEHFVVRQSTLHQMEQEEYRQVRRTGLLNFRDAIYPDSPNGEVHYSYHNENGTTGRTGGSNMINVKFKSLDEEQSRLNYGLVVEADERYKSARAEADNLLRNLESISSGQYNTQWLGSVVR